jgi:DNA ligase (NAD+)
MDIEGLGEKNVEVLLKNKLINDAADIYTVKKDELLKLERFANLSAQNLVSSIVEKKNPPLAKFVYALGIRHVGVQTAIDLATRLKSLDNLAKATVEELSQVDGVGEIVAESIAAWFADEDNKKLLEKFANNGVKPQELKSTGGPLTGKSFVITGSLSGMGREEAADKIRALGGTFQSAVGKGTTYLVVGNNVGASKLVKAEKLGINQIDEQALLDILKQ